MMLKACAWALLVGGSPALALRDPGDVGSLSLEARPEVADIKVALAEANHTRKAKFDLNPVVGTFVAAYNAINNVIGVVEAMKKLTLTSRTKLTGSILQDEEALNTIHSLLVKELNIHWKNWDCSECDDAEIKANYQILRWETEESPSESECVLDIKKALVLMRATTETLALKGYQWVRHLSSETFDVEHIDDFEGMEDTYCSGANVDGAAIGSLGQEVEGSPHCRDFPSESGIEVQRQCMSKCISIEGCTAFTYMQGEDGDDIDGTRCCFRTDWSEMEDQGATHCFPAAGWRLRSLSQAGVLEWLARHGFSAKTHAKIVKQVEEMELNGLALSVLTEDKFQLYLQATKEEAAKLLCLMDAEVHGIGADSGACDPGRGVIETYKSFQSRADHAIFFGLKSRNGAIKSHTFLMSAFGRMLNYLSTGSDGDGGIISKLKGYYDSYAAPYLRAYYVHGSANTVYSQAFGTVAFSPLAFTSSAAYLLKESTTLAWDSCTAIRYMILEENLWDNVDKYIQGGGMDFTNQTQMAMHRQV